MHNHTHGVGTRIQNGGARLTDDRLKLSQYVERLQGSGRYSFTSEDIARAVGGSPVAREAALRRLKDKGWIATPHRGFYVIVPVEYRSAGAPPATWFIDDLMRSLGRPYYVALLSAAAIHGAAHQQPQHFQVITDVPMRNVEMGRVRLDFHRNRRLPAVPAVPAVPVVRVKTDTGTMTVSTSEATALDLVRYAPAAGSLDNVATVLMELTERMEAKKLVEAARSASPPDVQRLGYLLEQLGFTHLSEALARHLSSLRRRPVLLGLQQKAGGSAADPRWYVVPNVKVVPDL